MTPRFKKAAIHAAKAIIDHGIRSLPVNPFNIIKQHKNWEAMTYKQFGDLNNLSEEEVIFLIGSMDGCAFYNADENKYLIIYNNNPLWIDVPQRRTWTIVHEIGHILLGHLKETGEAMITRAALSEEKYNTLEAEAEYFAASILAPFPVIYKLELLSWEQVMDFCGISKKAAINRLKHVKWRIERKYFFKDDLIIESFFSDFINQKTCKNCNFGLIHKTARYCPICGDKLVWGKGKMIYSGYELNEKSKPSMCPVCKNEQIFEQGDYCIICGFYLINKCNETAKTEEGLNIVSQSCETILPGNARYCYKCGNQSTYYSNELLEAWDVETTNNTHFEDDEIPF